MKRALLLGLVLAACAKKREGGLDVTVELELGVKSRCAQVAVKYPGGSELRTQAMPTAGKTALLVAIAQKTLPVNVTVWAEGFSDEACVTPMSPPERSKDFDATFEPGVVKPVSLVLPASGPMRESACADGLDSDQDGLFDCADADCEGQPCRGGGRCEASGCRGADTEAGLCDDTLDNDGDGDADCGDADCLGSLCRSGDRCAMESRCDATKTCGPTMRKGCSAPARCEHGPGSCDAATGACVYPFDSASTACDDQSACTSGDHCDGTGACVGAAVTCSNAPSTCFETTGAACDPAIGCGYPVRVGACDDLLSCTSADQCAADGGCSGTATVCAVGECQMPQAGCAADGGCLFDVRDAGAGCDAGLCNASGGCIPLFPYVPSNFTEVQVPTPPGADVLLDCGTSVVDTGVSGAPSFTNWCGQPLPGAVTIAQSGGPDAVLLSFTRLTVANGATLELRGARPVIIAGTREVVIAGSVTATAGALACADGGAGALGDEGLTNGGGGGGSFITAGGSGGAGSPTLGPSGGGGRAGALFADGTLIPLRGGCPGGLGARSGTPKAAAGGGAVQISSAGALLISGVVTAPGQGGPSANNGTGGNGAGSGGAVLLEALQLTLSAPGAITANGGGGGEGGGPLTSGQAGLSGTSDAGVAAGGSNIFNSGGPGGDGASIAQAAKNGGDGSAGTGNGGGGGGGLGRVRARASVSCSVAPGFVFSPAIDADGGC